MRLRMTGTLLLLLLLLLPIGVPPRRDIRRPSKTEDKNHRVNSGLIKIALFDMPRFTYAIIITNYKCFKGTLNRKQKDLFPFIHFWCKAIIYY